MSGEFQRTDEMNMLRYPDRVQLEEERHMDVGLEKIGYVLDQMFRIPGTSIRFGLDPIIGFFFPGAGDTVTTLIGVYVLLRSIQYGLPKLVVGRMVFNIAIDYFVGSIPLIGDMFDFAFKSNKKNITLLNRFASGRGKATWTDWLWVFLLLGAFAALVILVIFSLLWFIRSEGWNFV